MRATATVHPKITEAELQNAVIHLAKTLGYLVHHARTAPTRSGGWATPIQGDKGFPDLVLARRGRVIIAELKTDVGRLSPNQADWGQMLMGGDGEYFVWRPADWHDGRIERVLRAKP